MGKRPEVKQSSQVATADGALCIDRGQGQRIEGEINGPTSHEVCSASPEFACTRTGEDKLHLWKGIETTVNGLEERSDCLNFVDTNAAPLATGKSWCEGGLVEKRVRFIARGPFKRVLILFGRGKRLKLRSREQAKEAIGVPDSL